MGEVLPDSPLWHLPLSEKAFATTRPGNSPAEAFSSSVSIGDYFLAARRFLLNDGSRILDLAFREQAGNPLFSYPHPVSLSLSLDKHGVFYHPLKLVIRKQGHPDCALVLNGAVSEVGLGLIEQEHRLLTGISSRVPLKVFPRVYGCGAEGCEKGPIGFFLGEWFEGFHEFHLSISDGEPCILVWEGEGTRRFSLDEAAVIYERIAFVLTSAYNLETFEQIFPWHHAAGDFIVSPDLLSNPAGEGVGIRLITLRGYGVLTAFEVQDATPEVALLTGLLAFFLNLTIRMQLDKVDGIGETVFLGEAVLRATLTGFFRGLDVKEASGVKDVKQAFLGFTSGFTPEQLVLILENILSPLKNGARERALIQKNLGAHCRVLHALLKTEYLQDFY